VRSEVVVVKDAPWGQGARRREKVVYTSPEFERLNRERIQELLQHVQQLARRNETQSPVSAPPRGASAGAFGE
jgi:hypothetical protein